MVGVFKVHCLLTILMLTNGLAYTKTLKFINNTNKIIHVTIGDAEWHLINTKIINEKTLEIKPNQSIIHNTESAWLAVLIKVTEQKTALDTPQTIAIKPQYKPGGIWTFQEDVNGNTSIKYNN